MAVSAWVSSDSSTDVPSVLMFLVIVYGWVSSVSADVPHLPSVFKFLVTVFGWVSSASTDVPGGCLWVDILC